MHTKHTLAQSVGNVRNDGMYAIPGTYLSIGYILATNIAISLST